MINKSFLIYFKRLEINVKGPKSADFLGAEPV